VFLTSLHCTIAVISAHRPVLDPRTVDMGLVVDGVSRTSVSSIALVFHYGYPPVLPIHSYLPSMFWNKWRAWLPYYAHILNTAAIHSIEDFCAVQRIPSRLTETAVKQSLRYDNYVFVIRFSSVIQRLKYFECVKFKFSKLFFCPPYDLSLSPRSTHCFYC
jgi:hypothetical protein